MPMYAEDRQIARLRSAIEYGEKAKQPFCELEADAVRQYVGFHYGDNAAPDPVPIGLLSLLTDVYLRSTFPRMPQTLVTPKKRVSREIIAEAATIQADLNQWLTDMDLESQMRMVALKGILSTGVSKVGIANEGGYVEIDGRLIPKTQPFVRAMSLQYLLLDMAARAWDEQTFIGDRWQCDLEWAQENKNWDKGTREDLSSRPETGASLSDEYDLHKIGSSTGMQSEYREKTEVADVYDPKLQIVFTLDWQTKRVLDAVEHDGPENGPYYPLLHRPVPGNVLPLPPIAASLYDLHDLANIIFNKLGEQATREKNILGYRGSQQADAERIVKATDGEAVLQADGVLNTARYGGIQGGSLAFFLQLRDLFSWFGGNLDVLGGLSPSAETLGQEQILAASSSKLIADMQERQAQYTRKIVRHLSWYHWTDPVRESRPTKRIESLGFDVEEEWSPEVRRGAHLDYNYDIDVYSQQHDTPSQQVQALLNWVQQISIPLMDQILADGGTFDVKRLHEIGEEIGGIKHLSELIRFAQGDPPKQESRLGDQSRKNQSTYRNYTRRSVPGDSRQSRDREAMQGLMSMGSQQ